MRNIVLSVISHKGIIALIDGESILVILPSPTVQGAYLGNIGPRGGVLPRALGRLL